MATEIANFIFQQYPEKVRLSNSRRAKLWVLGKGKLTKSVAEGLAAGDLEYRVTKYKGQNQSCIFDKGTKEFVIANPNQVGTPREVPINGQLLWNGNASIFYNRAVKAQLKAFFVPALIRQNVQKITVPPGKYIHLEYIFFFPFFLRGFKAQDYFNHSLLYMKCFEDVLQEEGWLENDSPEVVRGGYARYVEIGEEIDRRLEIKIHLCRNRERVS